MNLIHHLKQITPIDILTMAFCIIVVLLAIVVL